MKYLKTFEEKGEKWIQDAMDQLDMNQMDQIEAPEIEMPSGEMRNYMFFNNLRKMKSEIEEILSLDEKMVDDLLCDGHDWADDHISVAKENIDHVYNFLLHSEK